MSRKLEGDSVCRQEEVGMEQEAAKKSGSTHFTWKGMTEVSMGVGRGGRSTGWKMRQHGVENHFRRVGCTEKGKAQHWGGTQGGEGICCKCVDIFKHKWKRR